WTRLRAPPLRSTPAPGLSESNPRLRMHYRAKRLAAAARRATQRGSFKGSDSAGRSTLNLGQNFCWQPE
ncbi:mCG145019, partial [Mus musculus]